MTPFTFLDPIFNTYTSPAFWGSILTQSVQFWNGLTFMAIITVMGIGVFLTAVFEVVMTYVLAFITMYILIGIAPIFIPLMLFGATSQFFYNWIKTLVKSMLVPVVFIVLILTFDVFIHQVLKSTVVSNHWGCLKYFSIHVNLGGKDLSLLDNNSSFCLPFFVPNVTNSYSTSSQSLLSNLQNISTTDLQATSMAGALSSAATGVGNDALAILDDTASVITSNVTNLAGVALVGYMTVIRAAFLYFTYAIVVKQLLKIAEEIVGKITGITASTFDKPVGQMKAAPQDIHSTLSRNVEIYKKGAEAVSSARQKVGQAVNRALGGINSRVDSLRNSKSISSRLLGETLALGRNLGKLAVKATLSKPSYEDDILQRPGRFVQHAKLAGSIVGGATKITALVAQGVAKVATTPLKIMMMPLARGAMKLGGQALGAIPKQAFKELYLRKYSKDKVLSGLLKGMSNEDREKFDKMSPKEKNRMLDKMLNKESSAYANERWRNLKSSRLLNPLKLGDETRFRRKYKGAFGDLHTVAGRAKYREAMAAYSSEKGKGRLAMVLNPMRSLNERAFIKANKGSFQDLHTAGGRAALREAA